MLINIDLMMKNPAGTKRLARFLGIKDDGEIYRTACKIARFNKRNPNWKPSCLATT